MRQGSSTGATRGATRRGGAKRKRGGWTGLVVRLGAAAALVYGLGFVTFVATPPRPQAPGVPTDGAVALTGDRGRIARGVALLEAGQARRLLISGVSPGVRKRELAAAANAPARLFACCVDLGFEAADTRSNAEETAAWAKARGYRSLRLVTSDYHYRRARLELAAELGPGVLILAEPVPARHRPPRLLWREYNKYVVRLGARALGQQ